MIAKKVNILGVEYGIIIVPFDDPSLCTDEDLAGYCCPYSKDIVISNFEDWQDAYSADLAQKQILRHEITHAFLFESGLGYNSRSDKNWAINEEMVDWIAWKGPQIYEAWKEAGCI